MKNARSDNSLASCDFINRDESKVYIDIFLLTPIAVEKYMVQFEADGYGESPYINAVELQVESTVIFL